MPPPPRAAANASAQAPAPPASESAERFEFRNATASPERIAPAIAELAPFYALCVKGDGALARVAARLARRQSEGQKALEVTELAFALRAEGSPYVWPRAWTLEGPEPLAEESLARMRSWLGSFDDGGERRCGIALAEAHGRHVLSAVAVDALGDLAPVPVQARAGDWLDVRATLAVPASGAKVVVLGPSGAPASVPTAFDGQSARARVKVDRPGAFTVQVLADVAGGPRPILEARVFTDTPPPRSFAAEPAPGEAESDGQRTAEASLLAMINAARASEGLSSLRGHHTLDTLALRHATAMREERRVAHDAGDGDPQSRLEKSGLRLLAAGENVAHAASLVAAHRALWASPSHRENMLQDRFDHVGIGIAPDQDGSLWVCELFGDLPGAAAREDGAPSPPAGPGLRAGPRDGERLAARAMPGDAATYRRVAPESERTLF